MSGLQLNVGLFSGINYVELVDQLIQLDGISKDNLIKRTERLDLERDALTAMMGRFLLASYMIRNLNAMKPFLRTDVSSSNASLISAVRTGTPVVGSYTFTPIQMASAQQTVAQGVASDTDPLGKTGTITLGKGWTVENDIQLKDINGGAGFTKGSIRLTDGNGMRATIDLRKAITLKDVINAINDNDDVDIIAELENDRIVLRDVSGGDPNKMSVQEVSGGSTAASLGLLGHTPDIDGVIRGNTIWRLGENMSLNLLNDGNGLVFDNIWQDISVNCKDGSVVNIDFYRLSTAAEVLEGAPETTRELTIGDLLNTINNSTDTNGVGGKITARISDDGKGIVIEDNTTGFGFTTLTQLSTNPIFRSLGLISGDYSDSIDIFTGLTVPATMSFQDKAGNSAVIEFTEADLAAIRGVSTTGIGCSVLISRMNAKLSDDGVQMEIQMNNSKDGFMIIDNSGGTGTIEIADIDGDLASRLKLTDTTTTDIIAALAGVQPGEIRLTDKNGQWAVIDITQTDLDALAANTIVGDMIDAVVDMFNSKVAGIPKIADAEEGTIRLTDKNGNVAEIEITQAELDSLTSLQDVVDLFNNKIDDFNNDPLNAGNEIGIEVQLNSGGNGLNIVDTTGGTISDLKVEQIGAIDEEKTITRFLGIDSETDEDEIAGRILGSLTGVEIEFADNGAGGVKVVDISGGTGIMTVERVNLSDPLEDSLVYRLGINMNSASDEIVGRSFDSIIHGSVINNGVFETRNLLGGLDTVLVSTLNGGFGLANAQAGGAIEVQDRAGNSAILTFSQAELNSMQTLTDAIKLFNAKLSNVGVGITVQMNDMKTGLQVVDTTGSGSHSLIFKDRLTDITIPGTPLIPVVPAVPGVDAVSADNGTGGTAILMFEETHWMNNFTFGFTTNIAEAGYDTGDKKFTFYLDPAIQTEPTATQDEMVQAAIDAQIASVWTSIFPPSLVGTVEPPTVMLTSGLAAQAFDDAVSGGETTIATGVSGSVMGVTYVPEVPEVPAVPPTTIPGGSDPKIASSFGLNVNAASSKVGGTSLNRQIISYNTPLSELNGGAGVNVTGGKIVLTDSKGNTNTLTIDSQKHKTVGDIIDAINRITNVMVIAKINETGDGIVLEEYAGGDRSFSCYDADSTSKFATSLGISGSVSQSQKDADGRMRISMSETHRIEVEATDSLDDIRKKINDLNVGYSASILVDGSSTPYRLSISSKTTGAAGAFNVDLSAIGLTTETMSEAKDAMIVYGDASKSTGLILSSNTNTFKGVLNGIDLTITGVSDTPVTITSASSNLDVKVALQTFVENYNTFREKLNEDTYFVVSENTGVSGNILWNSSVAKAFDRDITNMLLQTVEGIPGIRSLADLGITMRSNLEDTGVNKETGKLYFDEAKFEEAWAKDPEAVQKFFFDEKEYTDSSGKTTSISVGWAQKFCDLADNLVGTGTIVGKAQARIDVLTTTIDKNDQRVAFMEERLEWKRQMYLKQFYAMEQALAKMTTDSTAVSNIASAWSANYSSGSGYSY